MLFAGLMATAAASTSVVQAVTTGVFLGSSLYITSRAKKNPLKMPKR